MEINIVASTKEEAKHHVAEHLRHIVATDAEHHALHKPALDAVNSLIDLMPTDRLHDLNVQVEGTLVRSVREGVSPTVPALDSVALTIAVERSKTSAGPSPQRGPKGDPGETGARGPRGQAGEDGVRGEPGKSGASRSR